MSFYLRTKSSLSTAGTKILPIFLRKLLKKYLAPKETSEMRVRCAWDASEIRVKCAWVASELVVTRSAPFHPTIANCCCWLLAAAAATTALIGRCCCCAAAVAGYGLLLRSLCLFWAREKTCEMQVRCAWDASEMRVRCAWVASELNQEKIILMIPAKILAKSRFLQMHPM
jgi:hypothetical protein